MSDLIRKEQAIKAMKESNFGYTFEVGVAIEAVKALPTVEPEGMWKMSEDLISRKEMIRAVDGLGEDYISYYKLLLLIGKMPYACQTTKVENIRTGFISKGDFDECDCGDCGNCGETIMRGDKFCRECGAKLDWSNNG